MKATRRGEVLWPRGPRACSTGTLPNHRSAASSHDGRAHRSRASHQRACANPRLAKLPARTVSPSCHLINPDAAGPRFASPDALRAYVAKSAAITRRKVAACLSRSVRHDNGMITMAITIPGSPSPRPLNAAIHWAVGRAGKGRLTSKGSKATLTSCGIRSGSSAPSGRCPRPR
jgi:hypothetical protein